MLRSKRIPARAAPRAHLRANHRAMSHLTPAKHRLRRCEDTVSETPRRSSTTGRTRGSGAQSRRSAQRGSRRSFLEEPSQDESLYSEPTSRGNARPANRLPAGNARRGGNQVPAGNARPARDRFPARSVHHAEDQTPAGKMFPTNCLPAGNARPVRDQLPAGNASVHLARSKRSGADLLSGAR